MSMKDVGTYLRYLRKQLGLRQEDVAQRMGVSEKQVWRWERGEAEPTASSLAAYTKMVRGEPEVIHTLILGNNFSDSEIITYAETAHFRPFQSQAPGVVLSKEENQGAARKPPSMLVELNALREEQQRILDYLHFLSARQISLINQLEEHWSHVTEQIEIHAAVTDRTLRSDETDQEG